MAKNSICLQLIDPVLFQNDNKICQISNEGNAKQKKKIIFTHKRKSNFSKKRTFFKTKLSEAKFFKKSFVVSQFYHKNLFSYLRNRSIRFAKSVFKMKLSKNIFFMGVKNKNQCKLLKFFRFFAWKIFETDYKTCIEYLRAPRQIR